MLITAHTGCDGTPDNSLEFVRYAIALFPDAIEVDVHRRFDNQLVIAHDTDPEGRYLECPELKEVLSLLHSSPALGINCDLKDAGLEADTLVLHQAEAPLNPLYFSGTVSVNTLQANPEITRRAHILLNIEEIIPDFYDCPPTSPAEEKLIAKKAAEICRSCDVNTINIDYTLCSEVLQNTLFAYGINISVWCVEDMYSAQSFAKRGVFNLTTRSAKKMLHAFKNP